MFFLFKQKTANEMRISDWSSDVCSSDLFVQFKPFFHPDGSDPNDEIQFSAHYTVTDFDQDTSTQEFIIKILDDGPSVLRTVKASAWSRRSTDRKSVV